VRASVATLAAAAWLVSLPAAAARLDVEGHPAQGGLVRGQTEPGTRVTFDGRPVRLSPEARFIIGLGRDAPPRAELVAESPDGSRARIDLAVEQRQYAVQRIDGLPQETVTPAPELLERIRREAEAVKAARSTESSEPFFEQPFAWPVLGAISGVYGSERILNGERRQPHWGVDVAGPTGAPIVAAAGGVVALAAELFLTGNTVVIDHGYGLSTTYAHLARLEVRAGDRVGQGQRIGTLGATGRVTGPHLHWGADWRDTRLDPQLIAGPMPPRP
jgi:murein DD-endopeptidase MepM/ murein hydrolase activator NlpD